MLNKSEISYKLIFESITDAVYALDREWRYTIVNKSAADLVQMHEEKLIGNKITDLFPGIESTVFFKTYRNVMESRKAETVINDFVHEDGRTGWYEVRVYPVPAGILCIATDITDRKQTEELLRKSEEKLRVIFENANDEIVYLDKYGKIIDVNKKVKDIIGYKPEEMIGKKFDELNILNPEDLTAVNKLFNDAFEDGRSKLIRMSVRRKDGSTVFIETNAALVYNEEGPEGIVCIIREITERKLMEKALQQSEERYRNIFQNVFVSLWEEDLSEVRTAIQNLKSQGIIDLSKYLDEHPEFIQKIIKMIKVLDVNDITLKMYGAETKDELLGSLDKIATNESIAIFKEEIIAIAEGKKYIESEVIGRTFQGERLDLLINLTVPSDEEKYKNMLVSMMDITKRKRAEEALRRRTVELEALQETILNLITPHDLNTLLKTIVERAARLLNTKGGGLYLCDPNKQEVQCVVSLNTTCDYSGTILKYGEGAAGTAAQTAKPLIIDDYRTWSKRAAVFDEDHTSLAVLCVPMIWQGRVTGVLDVFSDLEDRCFTQADLDLLILFANHAAIAVENTKLHEQSKKEIAKRKLAEASVRKAHDELEKRVEERTAELIKAQDHIIRSERLAATGQLAASVAHEINSPLQAITVLLGKMKMENEGNKELIGDIDILKKAFSNVRDTVKKLMDLNRPGQENKQRINVNAIADSTVALMKSHLKLNKVKIETDLSPKVPDIIASPQQLGHVFLNLINNSVEAMSGVSKSGTRWKERAKIGGEISIKTKLEKDSIIIQVSDTGPGIAEKDLEHIFDPFYTRKKTMGMGVGLSICNGIIEDHNGTIKAGNAKDGGAVFTVILPTC
ncbi:MAG TPA: PAS domain S-box protein [Spirochaetes bacterium]|nr:PAS domain S-box protein [Spirochaetota bacterium]